MKNISFFNKDKLILVIRIMFHTANLLLIIFYLFPGSILGCFVYDNCGKQPQLTSDFNIFSYILSSNHVYVFLVVSMLGFFSYIKKNYFLKVLFYLIFLSIVLELMHLIIPERGFEIADLIGNILGVIMATIIILISNVWRKI